MSEDFQHSGFYAQYPNMTPRRADALPEHPYAGDVYQVGDTISFWTGHDWRHFKPDRELGHDIFWTDDGYGMGGDYVSVVGCGDKLSAALWGSDELQIVATDMRNQERREQAIRNGQGHLPVTCGTCGASCGTIEKPLIHNCPGAPKIDYETVVTSSHCPMYVGPDGKPLFGESTQEPETTDSEPELPPMSAEDYEAVLDLVQERLREAETENGELSKENAALRAALVAMNEKLEKQTEAIREGYWDMVLRKQREAEQACRDAGINVSSGGGPKPGETYYVTNGNE
jgi:hypothetical protein